MRWIRDAVAMLAGAALAGMVALVVYEGVPLGPLRAIPLIGPALESLADGRLDRERRAAREGCVAAADLAAAEAELAEVRRQLEAGRRALDGFAALLAAEQEKGRALEEENRKKDADYEAKLAAEGRSCLLDADDLGFLLRRSSP